MAGNFSTRIIHRIFQVVTDHPIHLSGDKRIMETVVDSTYKTKSGALNKARALQYCLEEDKNILGDDDWIVHLDEETLLTDAAVRGIMNFITSGKHSFGQGEQNYDSQTFFSPFPRTLSF